MAATNVTAGDVAAAIAAVLGDESELGSKVTSATSLEGDLGFDSVDVAALAVVLRDRYGPGVDLARYVAGLDIDEIIGLTVGHVAAYVNGCLVAPGGPRAAGAGDRR